MRINDRKIEAMLAVLDSINERVASTNLVLERGGADQDDHDTRHPDGEYHCRSNRSMST